MSFVNFSSSDQVFNIFPTVYPQIHFRLQEIKSRINKNIDWSRTSKRDEINTPSVLTSCPAHPEFGYEVPRGLKGQHMVLCALEKETEWFLKREKSSRTSF